MKYQTKDAAIRIRHLSQDDLVREETWVPSPDDPEFHVQVSPVANGWWTRAELAALQRRVKALLDTPLPVQRFTVGNPADENYLNGYDAAYMRGYLPHRIEVAGLEAGDAAVAAMMANIRAQLHRDQFRVMVDGRPWMDGDGRMSWNLHEAEQLAFSMHGKGWETIAVVPVADDADDAWPAVTP